MLRRLLATEEAEHYWDVFDTEILRPLTQAGLGEVSRSIDPNLWNLATGRWAASE